MELNLVTELGEASDRMLDPDLCGAAVEVVGGKVVVHSAVFQHVIALAKNARTALLSKGEDFDKTDIETATEAG